MTRKAKALGLALFAMFAMSALAAGGAQAAAEFHVHTKAPEKPEIAVTAHEHPGEGENTQTLTLTDGNGEKVECEELAIAGVAQNTTTSGEGETKTLTSGGVTAGFKYSGCTESFTGGKATVDSSGCHYLFTSDTTSGHAPVHLTCEVGEPVKITTGVGCTITIDTQTPTEGGVVYSNKTEDTENTTITATATVGGIHWSANFICQLGGLPGSGVEADYNGKVTVEAFEKTGGTVTQPEHTNEPLPIRHG